MPSDGVLGRNERRCNGDGGASLVEYALLVALIALVCVAALNYFQRETTNSLSRSSSAIAAAQG
jgi:Flp pilus assembly pilin Flp